MVVNNVVAKALKRTEGCAFWLFLCVETNIWAMTQAHDLRLSKGPIICGKTTIKINKPY